MKISDEKMQLISWEMHWRLFIDFSKPLDFHDFKLLNPSYMISNKCHIYILDDSKLKYYFHIMIVNLL